MARNCPGGQQVLTGVSKAKADPEKTVTRIAMDCLLADMVGMYGNQGKVYQTPRFSARDSTSVAHMGQHALTVNFQDFGPHLQTKARRV